MVTSKVNLELDLFLDSVVVGQCLQDGDFLLDDLHLLCFGHGRHGVGHSQPANGVFCATLLTQEFDEVLLGVKRVGFHLVLLAAYTFNIVGATPVVKSRTRIFLHAPVGFASGRASQRRVHRLCILRTAHQVDSHNLALNVTEVVFFLCDAVAVDWMIGICLQLTLAHPSQLSLSGGVSLVLLADDASVVPIVKKVSHLSALHANGGTIVTKLTIDFVEQARDVQCSHVCLLGCNILHQYEGFNNPLPCTVNLLQLFSLFH